MERPSAGEGKGSSRVEGESETPSGIQSDTADVGDLSTASQSLPTRDYTASATPTTLLESSEDKKTIGPGSSSRGVSSITQEVSDTPREGPPIDSSTVTGSGRLDTAATGLPPSSADEGDVIHQDQGAGASKEDLMDEPVQQEGEPAQQEGVSSQHDSIGSGDVQKEEGVAREEGVQEGVTGQESVQEGVAGMQDGLQEGADLHEGVAWGGIGDNEEDDTSEEDIPIELRPGYLPWDKDSQMLSLYQERKDELNDEYQEYVTANPELQSLLADFLQALFIQKPTNVFTFARDYFHPYGHNAPHLPSHPTTLQQFRHQPLTASTNHLHSNQETPP